MTSIAAESVASILVSSRQTRFKIQKPDYRELDIQDLDIRIVSGEKGAKGKGKGKAKKEGLGTELLTGASLKLQAGRRYALLGRNGAGKSTLLKAISDKLIPDIPEETRITSLQQTDAKEVDSTGAQLSGDTSVDRTVLEEIIDRATAKDTVQHEISELTSGANESDSHGFGTVHAYRRVTHERRQKKVFLLDKQARLRSGARGLAARKELRAFEKVVAESQAWVDQKDDEINAETLHAETEEAMNMLADLQIQAEPKQLAEVDSQAKRILAGLGFSDADMQRRVSTLSGGWTMRTSLASALLEEADILILDEPTNYLDLLGIMWLQNHLQSLEELDVPPTLILVSHDRAFIANTTTDLLILKGKSLTYFHGCLQAYEGGQAEKRLHMTRMKEAQDKQKAHIQDTITKSKQQGKTSGDDNKLRQAKTRQKKLDERWGLEVSAKGTRFKLNRDLVGYYLTMREEIQVDGGERPVSFVIPEPPDLRFPGALAHLEKAGFKYPAGKDGGKDMGPTLEGIDLAVHEGDRIAILGLNGAGKSTLIRLLVGQTRPSSGTVTMHPRIRLGYYSQGAVEALQALTNSEEDRNLTSLELLKRDIRTELDEGEIRALLGCVGLPGRLASDVPIRKLSGGQLVRCALARILWKRPQVLVLDEITTHLDYETVGAMRSELRDWPGAVVLVSHDRWFVRGVIEGENDEGEEADCGDGEDGKGVGRRRVVYRLFKGGLRVLEGGVDQFEGLLEKKVRKMVDA